MRETLMLFVTLKEPYKVAQKATACVRMAEQGNHAQWTEGDPWFCANRVFISGDNERSRLGHGDWANASTF